MCDFLRFLKEIEPDRTAHLMSDDENRRKLILKFIAVFHPDKQHALECSRLGVQPDEYLRMCSEITKVLNKELRLR